MPGFSGLLPGKQHSASTYAKFPTPGTRGHHNQEKIPLFPVSFTFPTTCNGQNATQKSPSVLNLYFIIFKSLLKEMSDCISPEGGLFMQNIHMNPDLEPEGSISASDWELPPKKGVWHTQCLNYQDSTTYITISEQRYPTGTSCGLKKFLKITKLCTAC